MEPSPLEDLKILLGETSITTTQNQDQPQHSTTKWTSIYDESDDSSGGRESVTKPRAGSSEIALSSIGRVSDPMVDFCPIVSVSRIHYKYKDKRPQGFEEADLRFFAKGKFWQRPWSLYYVCSRFTVQPLVLVPAKEVWNFLASINEALKLDWGFTKTPNVSGFLISFSDDGQPRPRFLGTSRSRPEFERLEKSIPAEDPQDFNEISKGLAIGDENTQKFRTKVEMAYALSRPAKVRVKTKEQRKIEAKERRHGELCRAQRYLGLRECKDLWQSGKSLDPTFASLDLKERAFGPNTVAPYPFDLSVVFICVDVEAYESNHSLITEIGISTLDTYDLVGIPPGYKGSSWMKKIRARHFRILENSGQTNGQYVSGCPDRFQFGQSEWISVVEAASTVASCFKHPFSAPLLPTIKDTTEGVQMYEPDKRNIVLVGHDVSADINYLRRVGYNVKNLSNLHEILDTADLYRAAKNETQIASLATLLDDLGIDAWFLHNAGNDASYTLQAMIGISVKHLNLQKTSSAPEAQLSFPVC